MQLKTAGTLKDLARRQAMACRQKTDEYLNGQEE
jgi:hypothetical protein